MISLTITLLNGPDGVHISKSGTKCEPVSNDEISYANQLDLHLQEFPRKYRFSSLFMTLFLVLAGYCFGCYATTLFHLMTGGGSPFCVKNQLISMLAIFCLPAILMLLVFMAARRVK